MIGKLEAESKRQISEMTIQVWNQLSADTLGTLSCKPSNFRKMVSKVITKEKSRGGIIEVK
jgi:hypothetical protein